MGNITQNQSDVLAIRQAFWDMFYGKLTLTEMQIEIDKILHKQLKLENCNVDRENYLRR